MAEDRRISVEDPEMRHGRKTRTLRIDGYKRHVLVDLDTDLVRSLREQCTTSSNGRALHIHPDEPVMAALHARQQTPEGRARLRERVKVEHTLAHVGHCNHVHGTLTGDRGEIVNLGPGNQHP